MKKRMILPAILLAVLMALTLTLAACGNGDDNGPVTPPTQNNNGPADNGPDDPPETNGETGTVTRGVWDGNVFTSEFLGLTFTMPDGWVASTDAEIAALMGLAPGVLEAAGGDIPEDLWDTVESVHDMMAMNPLTGVSVQILFDRLEYPYTAMSTAEFVAEYLELMEEIMEMMGMEFEVLPGTTRIGNSDWHSFASTMEMFGMTITSRSFFSVHEGFSRTISITYSEGSESPEEILAMFS